ncbi:MAG: hypothetical protein K0R39_1129 [Symbiobacteriaceae bacterium]|jgi:hypothetical protein|nr:hypothetical protein [Symbiobacteriaceae bacterium]
MEVTLVIDGAAYPLDAAPPGLIIEHGTYRLRLEEERSDADPDGYQAEAGDALLPLVRERAAGGRIRLEWEWTPDFFTGEFAFVIRYQGKRIYPPAGAGGRVVVAPDLRKLTADHYEAMVADLLRWTAGGQVPAPGEMRGATSRAPAESALAQLALLQRHWDAVERQVEEVLARPRRRLVQRTVEAGLHRVQTVTGRQWLAAVERPWTWAAAPVPRPGPLARARTAAGGRLPQMLPQDSAYSTLAVPENLFVVTMLADLRQGLGKAITMLAGAAPGPTRAVAEKRTAQARTMLKRVSSWLRETWLADLDPAPGQISPTPALLKHPVYGSLWRFYLRWRRAVALVDGADRPLTLDRTYQLYEYWCFLTVVRAVARLLGRDADAAVGGAIGQSGATLRLALELGKRLDVPFAAEGVTVSYQRAFRYHSGAGGPYSISHMQMPDITIEGPGGLLLLDPKYRVGHEGILGGLGDMHRYRDALVTADGRRAVAAGFLLCPGEPVEPGDRRYLAPDYQERWGFGILRLAPGAGEEVLGRVLGPYVR